MKTLILLFAIVILPQVCFSSDMQRIGFKAYSTTTAVTCVVAGMKTNLAHSFQGFAPTPSYSRTYNLGTKGYANYSTGSRGAVKWQCRNTGTESTIAVKVQYGGFLNGLETHFFTLEEDTLVIQ